MPLPFLHRYSALALPYFAVASPVLPCRPSTVTVHSVDAPVPSRQCSGGTVGQSFSSLLTAAFGVKLTDFSHLLGLIGLCLGLELFALLLLPLVPNKAQAAVTDDFAAAPSTTSSERDVSSEGKRSGAVEGGAAERLLHGQAATKGPAGGAAKLEARLEAKLEAGGGPAARKKGGSFGPILLCSLLVGGATWAVAQATWQLAHAPLDGAPPERPNWHWQWQQGSWHRQRRTEAPSVAMSSTWILAAAPPTSTWSAVSSTSPVALASASTPRGSSSTQGQGSLAPTPLA